VVDVGGTGIGASPLHLKGDHQIMVGMDLEVVEEAGATLVETLTRTGEVLQGTQQRASYGGCA
jgi:hypothetical protein